MIVVDASTMIEVLTDEGTRGNRCRAAVSGEAVLLVPDHFRIEVFQGIRGLLLGGHLDQNQASAGIADLVELRVRTVRSPTHLFGRMWELRDNLTAYDAAYVALAELRGCALVTADARLAAAPGLRCEVRLATA